MTPAERVEPRLSVVIPTYNRSGQLRRTLTTLTQQSIPPDEFEVIVADDGSSDDTAAVVKEFADRLRVAYTYQEDLGFRAGAARNAGARLATAPLLVFLDTGALAGRGFLEHHLRVHDTPRRRACVGYAYGYNPDDPMTGVAEVLDRSTPEQAVEHFADNPAFRDLRHDELLPIDFDLNRRVLPWSLFWTINVSMLAEDFWGVGGFDEQFVGWGGEDLELAYRLYLRGLDFHFSREAWAIEIVNERDWDVLDKTLMANLERFLAKHRHPYFEIGIALHARLEFGRWEEGCAELAAWARQVRDREVADEISEALRGHEPGDRIAILGCGSAIPASLPPAVLMDFDRDLLDAALAGRQHTGHHSAGLRTPLPDQSADLVVITSRLAGLRERWSEDLLAEAHRIGRRVIDAGEQ